MSLAADTREAVRARPVLYDALRAGIVNYTAAADSLDLDGDREAIATALRRFAESLDADGEPQSDRSLTVRMERGVDPSEVAASLVSDEDAALPESATAIRATGNVDSTVLATTLDRLRIAEIDVLAGGVAADTLVILVPQRSGATALQLVERVA